MQRKQQKRPRDGGGGDRDGGGGDRGGGGTPPVYPAPALKRRCRSFDLEIRRGCDCRDLHQVATSCAQAAEAANAAARWIEEATKVFTTLFNRYPGARIEHNLPPTYKLCFLNSLSDVIYTKREVRAADGGHIKIAIVASNQLGSIPPRLLSANVKIVVLKGDFNANNHDDWTSEEFDNHIERPRDKAGALLTGKLDVKLENGEAYLHGVNFIDNSSFTRSRKFTLGVKIIGDVGEQVQEGVTEPFTVKDRRGEAYKKSDIPNLDDKLWRLKCIRKNGALQRTLEQSGVSSVKDFLRQYYKDENALRNILHKASDFVWTTIVDHAKTCVPGSALYSHFIQDKDTRLYFSSTGQIVGATIAGEYNAFSDLDTPWKAQVEEWRKDAYERMTYHQPDYEMYNSQPKPINCGTPQGSITPKPKSTELFPDHIIHEAVEHGTSKGNEFPGNQSQQCTLKRLGSRRVRALPSARENNESDATLYNDVQLDSNAEIQYETPEANYNTGSVTLHCHAADEIIAPIALDQAALTMHQEDYQMPSANDGPSLGHWSTEQEVASQYESPLSPSIRADFHVFSTQNCFNMDQFLEDLPDNIMSVICTQRKRAAS